jgi:hypothetical protein
VPAEDVLGINTGSGVSLSGTLANGATVFVGSTAIGTITSNGSSGNALTISLNVDATASDATTLLRAITYANNNLGNPSTATRTLTTTFADGEGATATATSTVHVTAVDDAPVATASAGASDYIEGGPVAVDASLSVSDVDSGQLSGAVITITGNHRSGDLLLFQDQSGISTQSFDAATGILTLTGTTTLANWQTALQSIQFSSGDDPGSLDRTISFVVTDAENASSVAGAKIVHVTLLNDAPSATATSAPVTFTENGSAVALEPNLVLSDPDNTMLAFAKVKIGTGFHAGQDILSFAAPAAITGAYDATTGELVLTGVASLADYQAALRSVTYSNTSEAPDTATRTITFSASDGSTTAQTAVNTVSVVSVNDAPQVANLVPDQTSPANALWTFQVPGNSFTDADNATLSYSATLGNGDPLPAWLAFDAATQTFAGTPPRNFVGGIELKISANDGSASTSDKFMLVVGASNPGTHDLTAGADTYTVGSTGEIINGLGGNDYRHRRSRQRFLQWRRRQRYRQRRRRRQCAARRCRYRSCDRSRQPQRGVWRRRHRSALFRRQPEPAVRQRRR